jgi:hypothetical protein
MFSQLRLSGHGPQRRRKYGIAQTFFTTSKQQTPYFSCNCVEGSPDYELSLRPGMSDVSGEHNPTTNLEPEGLGMAWENQVRPASELDDRGIWRVNTHHLNTGPR